MTHPSPAQVSVAANQHPERRRLPGQAGDLLLAFQRPPAQLPSRRAAAPWQWLQLGESVWLSFTEPTNDWPGLPLLHLETEGWSAWLLGELYGSGEPAQAVAELLHGRTDSSALNGHFILWARERETDQWHFWTNRFATLHAYIGSDGRRTAVGTYSPAVAAAAARPELDWEGLTSFFSMGFFLADRTHLKDVRQQRPATHLVLDGNGRRISEQRYWHWHYEPDRARSYEDTVAEFAMRFEAVMAEQTAAGLMSLPISGGLDSRSTVAALTGPGRSTERLRAYTYGYAPDSVEIEIGRQIARARELPFQAFVIEPYLWQRLPFLVETVEGFAEVTVTRQTAVVDRLAALSNAHVAAHWGDVYLDDMGLVNDGAEALDDRAVMHHALHKVRRPGRFWLLDNICRQQTGGQSPDDLLETLFAPEFAAYDHIEDPDFRVKAFKTDFWSARWTMTGLRVFQAAAIPRLPFYDTRLTDWFLSVPSDFVAGRRLQIEYLRRFAPDLARIPWQQSGRDLFQTGTPDPFAVVGRARRKARRMLIGKQILERNFEVQFLNPRGQAGLQTWLLEPGLRLHDYVAKPAISGLLEAFYRDPLGEKRGWTVAMLLTFSAWLELSYGLWADR